MRMADCHPRQKHYGHGLCHSCYSRQEWKKRQVLADWRERHLQRNFGISEINYDDLLKRQGDVCAICFKRPADLTRRLAVDHDHATGEIRGLLCNYCNRLLGAIEHGDWLLSALLYLNRESLPVDHDEPLRGTYIVPLLEELVR